MSPTIRAASWMLGAIISFTAMAIAGRELGDTFDTFEIMMWRSAFGFLIVLIFATVTGTRHEIGRQAIGTHLIRNVFHFTGQNLWFFAVTTVPLAQVFALEFTTPLWVIVLSVFLLGERLTLVRGTVAVMGFIGILIVSRPDMAAINGGILAAASCAIFFALTYVFTKRLTRSESITAIMFYLTFFQLVFGLITAGYDGDIAVPTVPDLPWLLLVGICGLLAHFCITKALSLAPAAVVAPVDFARLPIIAIVAMLVYGEALDPWVFVGAIIIFAGNYLNIWSETRKTA
ncbi:EamA family transporter [Sulfitobacter sp. JBTF-M27]|uniref:EamA family transporter n=1 Tax=Sulfitobacter sediminilitoris TaxID=2698830 RepID=A0A6P0CCK6_9RHOB|nr:DMT family transporter [Sulfitobacter sediminilitoris]NEK22213.1 EamA family transporter [Sulfitobacter sediminilitoris]